MSKNDVGIVIPSNPEDRKKIAGVFRDMSDQMTKMDAIKDYLKEAKKSLADEYELSVSDVNKLLRLYHDVNAEEYFGKQDDLQAFYTEVIDNE